MEEQTIFVLVAVAVVNNVAATLYLFIRHWDKIRNPALENQPKPDEWRRVALCPQEGKPEWHDESKRARPPLN